MTEVLCIVLVLVLVLGFSHAFPGRTRLLRAGWRQASPIVALLALLTFPALVRGEAMLELFNVPWNQLTQKIPEIAEAGYDSLWLPPPAKGGSPFSVGYDQFDPFDLGDKNQVGTIPTRWG